MGPRALLVILVAIVVLGGVPTASSQNEVDPYGYGVLYFLATGKPGSSGFSFSPSYDGKNLLPFDGCGFIQAKPDKDVGVVQVAGLVDGTNTLTVEFGEFEAPGGAQAAQGGIAVNTTLDGSVGRTGPSHPSVFARAAAWGSATLQLDTTNFTDTAADAPDAEAKRFRSYFLLSRDGFRDEDTHAIQTKSGATYDPTKNDDSRVDKEDWEMHLRLEAEGVKRTGSWRFQNPGDSPDGSIIYEEEHRSRVKFPPFKPTAPPGQVPPFHPIDPRPFYSGSTVVTFTATTNAPPTVAPTKLTFRVLAPGLQEVANVTLMPDVNQPATKKVEFPIQQYGDYEVHIDGRASMAKWTMDVLMKGPEKYDLNFWWDDVSFGKPARDDMGACLETISQNLAAVSGGVGRGGGPSLSVELLAATAAVTILGILFLVKLAADEVVSASFKSVFKRS